jgi:hypothetical protein
MVSGHDEEFLHVNVNETCNVMASLSHRVDANGPTLNKYPEKSSKCLEWAEGLAVLHFGYVS